MTTIIFFEKLGLNIIDIELSACKAELSILQNHLDLVEREITRLTAEAKQQWEEEIDSLRLKHLDEDDWGACSQEINGAYERTVEVDLPRLFRGAHLIMLYAAYESAIDEIKRFNRIRKNPKLEINTPESISMLKTIRDAFAHGNGRIEAVSIKKIGQIKNYAKEEQGIGLSSAYIVVSAELLRKFTDDVRASIERLIEILKQNRHKAQSKGN